MASYEKAVESYKKAVTTAASVAASAMLLRGVVNELVPHEVRDFIFSGIHDLRSCMSSQHTIVIEETEGYANNQIYEAARLYLATRLNTNMQRLRLVCRETSGGTSSNGTSRQIEVRSFELSFHKKHKEKALYSYLPFILARAKEIKEEDKSLKLHLNEGDSWFPIDLHHPSTFDTLAMDAELKRTVMDDLSRFVKRKDYYRRIGKAWKRGYLLYGPPGTGKSSLIAAMANYLKFDIYDLELTEVGWNSTLRRLLIGMSNKSILVIEDIDCTIKLQQRDENEDQNTSNDDKVTLSGLLNFVDGLWSTSGEERIIVFTTNYKERLDPALLRPGRMDMQIHMSYCGVDAFRALASNYHAINDHELFPEIEGLIREVEVTPAAVAEELMRSDDTDAALQGLLNFLKAKRKGNNEDKVAEQNVEDKDKMR
uniref:AAA+ ATPase domain-containing protein n=1 Tax=Ananas comosus var. bracteatus TaxID=296719 RepID=A0A6V7P059_ANACO|nr:unnamed protein product [Ananas comosus var. bracteatus]